MCGEDAASSDAEQLDYLERYMNLDRECGQNRVVENPLTSTHYTEAPRKTPSAPM